MGGYITHRVVPPGQTRREALWRRRGSRGVDVVKTRLEVLRLSNTRKLIRETSIYFPRMSENVKSYDSGLRSSWRVERRRHVRAEVNNGGIY